MNAVNPLRLRAFIAQCKTCRRERLGNKAAQ